MLSKEKGSMTAEAAIAVPIFFAAVLCVIFIVRVVYIQNLIQHAIVEAANQIAVYSYMDKIGFLKTQGVTSIPTAQLIVKSSLDKGGISSEQRLKKLMVVDGFDGLNFTGTSLLNEEGNVDIKVYYKVRAITPIKIIPDIEMAQRATVKSWVESEDPADVPSEENVWKLPPKERGKRIQDSFGRNMPNFFPVVTKLEDRKITSVKSINLNDITYRKPANLKYKLKGFIDDLEGFNGGEYGGEKITRAEYTTKELLVVIPPGTLNAQLQKVINEINIYGSNKAVKVSIKEYGG